MLLGPVSYLWLGKSKDESNKLDLLDALLPVYEQCLIALAEAGAEWVQIDEPILATELDQHWQHALSQAYFALHKTPVKLLLTTYFGPLRENLNLACELPTAGLHIDAVKALDEVIKVIDWLPPHKILSLGVINGRNIWKADLNKLLNWLEPITSAPAGSAVARAILFAYCMYLSIWSRKVAWIAISLTGWHLLYKSCRNWLY